MICSVDECERPRRKRTFCTKHYQRWRTHGDPSIGRVYPPCSIDGCPIKATTRSPLCTAHLRASDTDGPHGLPVYFADKIAFAGVDDCWTWLRHANSAGYGYVMWLGVMQPVHRVTYRLLVADFAPELEIDHLCHTRDDSCPGGTTCPHRLCVNPSHLEPVTQAENKRRVGAARTRCKFGHDWAEFPPQIVHRSSGKVSRWCAECARIRDRARRASA